MKKFNLVLSITLLFHISCEDNSTNINDPELENIYIGLYADSGATDVDKVESMLKNLGSNYSILNKSIILNGELNNFDIILFPGGDMWVYKDYLSSKGIQKIRNFVQLGGGYIGICGGSYFAANKIIWRGWANEPRQYLTIFGLGIFSGTADGPIEDFAPSYQNNKCKVNINQDHPVTVDVTRQLSYLYSFGPKFIIADSTNVFILGRTVIGNNPVILAVKEQQGRVFLTSLHPEFDESKASWKMIRNAILWSSNKNN